MGSSKKHKGKGRERDKLKEKRDKSHKKSKKHSKIKEKNRGKEKDISPALAPLVSGADEDKDEITYVQPEKSVTADATKTRKRKHKERRKHSSISDHDSDVPVPKSYKHTEKDKAVQHAEENKTVKHNDKDKSVQHTEKDKSIQHTENDKSANSRTGNGSHYRDESPQKTATRSSESSLSITDANRWRSKLGLKPLQIKEKQSKKREHSPSPPPKSSGSGGDSSLSIGETNKLRLKLGLKPLQIDSGSGHTSRPSRPAQAKAAGEEDNVDDDATINRLKEESEKEGQVFWKEKQEFVHAPPENISQQRKAEHIREKISAHREKRRLEEKLFRKGLADSDSDDDAAKWVEKTKKLTEQKALAEKRAKALAELDDEFGVGDLVESEFQKVKTKSYNSKDLKGMKVMHDSGRIEEGETVIMTLDDRDVLDEKDDVLVNVNMIDDEKFEKNLKDRKMRPELHGYNVFDELDGFDEDGMPHEKKVLSKYDEEISGLEKKTFVLGEDNVARLREVKAMEKMQKANKILESVKAPFLTLGSDFFSPDEMTSFKITKKKVRKVRKVLRADDLLKDTQLGPLVKNREKDLGSRKKKKDKEDIKGNDVQLETTPVNMDIDIELDDLPPAQEIDVSDIKIEDEGDLDFQLALSKARKAQQKKSVVKPSVEAIAEMVRMNSDVQELSSGFMMLHATAEFCRTLGDIPSVDGGDIYGDEKMARRKLLDDVDTELGLKGGSKYTRSRWDFETEEQQNYAAEMEERGKWNEVEIDETPVDVMREPELEKVPILEEEPEVGPGIGGALKLAMKKGYFEQEKRKPSVIPRMKHLQAKNYSIEDKNYEDDRIPHHKRDVYSGPLTDFKDKEGYKPEIKLEYNDDDGRKISAKEAFRLLSHKFHGKGSGKNKIDKKRRKLDQDKLMQHMNSTDTPLGTLELLQERQKQSHTPYIVLSGNKAGHSSALTKISKR